MMRLGLQLFLFIYLVAGLSYRAWGDETPVVSATSSEDELRKSFQREYVYLASQKESLARQKNRLEQGLSQRILASKSQTTALQKELVKLTSENDDNHEYLMSLEKRKKDLQKRGSSLESTFKKANSTLMDFEAGLHFEVFDKKSDISVPDDVRFDDFEKLIMKSTELISASGQIETFNASFIDLDGKLVDGSITRIGRSAAIGSVNSSHYVLGPNGEGQLKALELTEAPTKPSLSLYVFESIHKIAKIKKDAGFVERLADLSPILFLATMLLMVLGLFVVLIKV